MIGENQPTVMNTSQADEAAVRQMIENWASAVRAKDLQGIVANHSYDLLMFDVPPPFESRGMKAYEETWRLFYSSQPEPIAFDILRMDVFVGTEVAFVVALMQCAEHGANGVRVPLDFRLTVGLHKIDNGWVIVHEHHSVPAT